MTYRIPSPPLAPTPARSSRGIVLAAIVGSTLLAATTAAGVFMLRGKLLSSGVTIDPWSLPEASVPAVSLAARWISAPLSSPSGVVFGVIDGGVTPAIVAIDGGTGALRWKTAIAAGAPLSDYRHGNGWNRNDANVPTEFQPVVPVLGLAGSTLVVAFDHGWATFDAGTGALRKTDRIPASLPAIAPQGGFCLFGNDAWVAMADGRDGGLRLTAAGTTNGLRVERPADCNPPVATLGEPYGYRASPLQQLRGNQVPSACMRKKHKATRESNQCKLWGKTPTGITVAMDYSEGYFGNDSFTFGKSKGDLLSPLSVLGVEASVTALFVTVSESATYSSETKPPPGSFARVERHSGFRYRVVLSALDQGIAPRWTTTIATLDHGWAHPLVFAADRAAPVQNLYLFTPGKLVALDQATGQARFRIEVD